MGWEVEFGSHSVIQSYSFFLSIYSPQTQLLLSAAALYERLCNYVHVNV